MGGLNKITKMYGAISIANSNGDRQDLVWDHVAEKAVPKNEMAAGTERWAASEKKKYGVLRKQMDQQIAKNRNEF